MNSPWSQRPESPDPAQRSFPLRGLMDEVESVLSRYYGFTMPERAGDFTVDLKDFIHLTHREPGSRAEVCLIQEEGEDSFLGVYISAEVSETLCGNPPQKALNTSNLDAFCVLVEELSHFHLIFQRCLQARQVSHMELEWQAEIDKVLLSALFMQNQAGSFHLEPLTQLIFDQAQVSFTSPYQIAHRYAARFWQLARAWGVGRRISLTDRQFRKLMQSNYQRPLHEKAPFSPGETNWLAKKKYSQVL